jgi:nidogen (entactin)
MTAFTPQPFPVSGIPPFLAGYWGDVDTTPRNGGAVYYRATTDPALLNRASTHITGLFTQVRRTFQATRLFIATWERVGYYEEHTDLVRTSILNFIA